VPLIATMPNQLNRDRQARTSPALWLPVIWLAIGASRNVSLWLAPAEQVNLQRQYLDGSPLDRAVFTSLLVLSFLVLIRRRERTGQILTRNAPLLLFFLFCAISAAWSDFPFVTLRRWTKAVGNFTMMLVVLTDADAISALKQLLTRTAFVLIPCSVLLILYYPDLGRYYHPATNTVLYSGVTTESNSLGCTCMVLGLGLLWQLLEALRQTPRQTGRVLALGTVLGLDLWLLYLTKSLTSFLCFVLGAMVILILTRFADQRPGLVHLMVGGMLVLGVVTYAFRDPLEGAFDRLLKPLGRSTTLSGRSELWEDLLQVKTNPWLGVGFESFFLGDRLEPLWKRWWWHPNQAHNGYLETYLTLGRLGLGLLALLMITGSRNVIRRYREDPGSGSLCLAYLVIAPFYNITEAAFKVMNPYWIIFLLAIAATPAVRLEYSGHTSLPAASDPQPPESVLSPGRPPRVAWRPAHILRWLQHHRARRKSPVPQ